MIGDGAGFDEAEAEGGERFKGDSILIKASRESDWICERQAKTPELSKWAALETIA
jgi:hypothetical protein